MNIKDWLLICGAVSDSHMCTGLDVTARDVFAICQTTNNGQALPITNVTHAPIGVYCVNTALQHTEWHVP